MASEESFSRILRGYDPAEVDPLIQKLRRELLSAKTLHDDAIAQVMELELRLAEIQLEHSNKSKPTAEGLSTQLNTKLKKADKLAAEIVSKAESDALFIRSAAEKTSSQFIEAARESFEQARAEASAVKDQLTAEARQQAAVIISEAQVQAAEILARGQEEAQRLRGEASTIAANLRAESKNEVARYAAEAQREAEEFKLVLATSTEKKINDEILHLLKLNADNAAIRADMEKELQERHQESVLQTEKYIGAAEAQLATARTRLRAIEVEFETVPIRAREEAEAILEEARRAAQKQSLATETLVRKKIADAEKYVASVLSSIYSQLEGIRVEREAVAAYFDALRLELEKTLGTTSAQKKLQP
ncbi:MAG: hypothetical protein RL720_847 [Actinomycetota bacterium]